jgi:hypothetical protein
VYVVSPQVLGGDFERCDVNSAPAKRFGRVPKAVGSWVVRILRSCPRKGLAQRASSYDPYLTPMTGHSPVVAVEVPDYMSVLESVVVNKD